MRQRRRNQDLTDSETDDIEEIMRNEVPAFIQNIVQSSSSSYQSLRRRYRRGEVVTYSPTAQVAVGATTGYAAGYIASKLGKYTLALVGGAAIILPLAEQYGYIRIDWKRVQKDAQKIGDEMRKEYSQRIKNITKSKASIQEIAEANPQAVASLIGGFILGFAL